MGACVSKTDKAAKNHNSLEVRYVKIWLTYKMTATELVVCYIG
jgi:hypothetical protein